MLCHHAVTLPEISCWHQKCCSDVTVQILPLLPLEMVSVATVGGCANDSPSYSDNADLGQFLLVLILFLGFSLSQHIYDELDQQRIVTSEWGSKFEALWPWKLCSPDSPLRCPVTQSGCCIPQQHCRLQTRLLLKAGAHVLVHLQTKTRALHHQWHSSCHCKSHTSDNGHLCCTFCQALEVRH